MYKSDGASNYRVVKYKFIPLFKFTLFQSLHTLKFPI